MDLRTWDTPFAFSITTLADTNAAILKTETPDFKTQTVMDSTFQTVKIRRTLLKKDFYQPVTFNQTDYVNFRLEHDAAKNYREACITALTRPAAQGGGEALTIEVPFKIKSKTFNKIFGGDRVRLRISGNININGGFRREGRSQVQTVTGQNTDYSFHIDQTQRFKITGEVGDKVSVDVDQNSERTFDFENSLKLTYTGYEDEVIQKIEAGNVSLGLAGTQLATFSGQNKGLFGLKTEMKVGALSLTTIASMEKGQKNKVSVSGGAQQVANTIDVNMPLVGRYFFIDRFFRNQYKHYNADMTHQFNNAHYIKTPSTDFYLYRQVSGSGIQGSVVNAYAVYDSVAIDYPPYFNMDRAGFYNLPPDSIKAMHDRHEISDRNFQDGFWALIPSTEYTIDGQLGYIRLNQVNTSDVLAMAYKVHNEGTNADSVFGALTAPNTNAHYVLKLLRPVNPLPSDSTWKMAWRNVYSLGGGSIDREGFSFRIVYQQSGATETETFTPPGGSPISFLTMMGLDLTSPTAPGQPDGLIDDNPLSPLINYSTGEIFFPDLRPFNPEGYTVGNANPPYTLDSTFYIPSIYNSTILTPTNFKFKVQSKSVNSTYQLGPNVLEGSEEVTLSGRKLNKGTDYVIDYYSGTLTILNNEALSPSANLQILYESGEMFQLDKKTLLGVRGEYALWDQSFLGATMLYMNERPLQDRVKIGSEPLRNFLWDMNTHLVFKPQFLTTAIDHLPLVSTEAPSSVTLEGEYAQVHPNPNSLNNAATGDNDGVAYVDDFESIKKTTPLGIMRRQWNMASYPTNGNPNQDFTKGRGRLAWFNPYDQIKINEIWENRPTNANVAQSTNVLSLWFRPSKSSITSKGPNGQISEYQDSWGGIMRGLSSGYYNQTKAKYIELMVRVGKQVGSSTYEYDGMPGKLHIDLGQISEDVVPNDTLNTEDQNMPGMLFGNNYLDDGEDTGIYGSLTYGVNATHPDWDQWHYDSSKPYDVWHINGTQGNANDEGGRYPDTEDLNNSHTLDIANNFFRYTIDLSETDPDTDYTQQHQGGTWDPASNFLVTAPNTHKWKLYRIPIEAGIQVGNPTLEQISFVRVWMDGLPDSLIVPNVSDPSAAESHYEVSLATLEIVGNEWEAAPIPGSADTTEHVSVQVINTYDNRDYTPPPGVAGYRDPLTDIVSQEQSLLLRINDLSKDSTGIVVKRMYDTQDYLEYRKLKMFIHGGGVNPDPTLFTDDPNKNGVWMFLRFGADTTNNYYEYRQRVYPGWDTRNNIEIDFADLTQLKLGRSDPLGYKEITVNGGDILAIKGNPSISQVRQYTVGITPRDRSISKDEGAEIWLDELRVSSVKKTEGRKGRASMDMTLADLATFNANMEASDGNFHNINERVGTRANAISGRASGTLQLQKFLNPKWGFNIPVTGNFEQSQSVPYYFTNSDILVNQSNPQQVDTVKTYNLNYGAGINVSKPTPSASNWLKYSLDKLSGGYDYARHEQTDPYYAFSNSTTHGANVTYNLTFGRPGVTPLTWLGGIPLLGKYSKTKFYPLITKLTLGLRGTESISTSHLRVGTNQFTHTFNLEKNLSSGWHPFESMTFDYSRTHKADLLKNPANHKDMSDILRGDLAWDEDNDVSQTLTASYTPRLLSWLDTEARYNSAYHWGWSPPYNASGQSVSNNTSISGAFTLKLTQIFKPPGARGGAGGPQQLGGQGYSPYGQQAQQPDQIGKTGGSPDQGQSQSQPPTQPQQQPTNPSQQQPTNPSQQPGTGLGQPGLPGQQTTPGDTTRHDSSQVHTDTTRVDTTTRELMKIERSKRQGAFSDFWYALRYTVTRLRDIRVDYSQTNQWADPLADGQAGLGYQLGLNSHAVNQIADIGSYTGYSTRTRSDDWKVKSGLDFTKDFKVSLNYNYRWSRNASNSINGAVTESQLYFFQSRGDSMRVFQIPIPEWSISWTGWEKFAMFKNLVQTMSLEHTFTGSRTTNWTQDPGNVSKYDYSRNFSPLVGVNMSFKKGITANARLNWTETGTVQLIPTPSKTRNRQTNLSITASYAMKSGFKIPIPVWPFKNKRFKNNTTVGMTINLSSSHQEQEAGGKFAETNFTTTWSIKPSLDYTFSNTVTGGMHFEYGQNKSKTGDSNFQDFGISVNITIRG